MGYGSGFSGQRIAFRAAVLTAAGLALANCSLGNSEKIDPNYGVAASPRVTPDGESVLRRRGRNHVGKPYVIAGRVYTPHHNPNYRADGFASWYGDAFHGRLTANGEVFDMRSVTAAHPTLPLPSYVRVTNLTNGKSLIVRVNDRGPFHSDRVIDLSSRAADLLAFKSQGVARVRVEYVGPASTEGSDDRVLVASLRHDGTPAELRSPVRVADADPRFLPQPEPDAQRRPRQVAGANAWSFGPDTPRRPAPRVRPTHSPEVAVATPPERAGFNAAPPVPAASFSPASVTGRGLY
jgi:rare lipoprotein A